VKLQRADKLIGGLGGERMRWQSTVEQLTQALVNVVGDVVVAAGSIAYSGAHPSQAAEPTCGGGWRQQCLLSWENILLVFALYSISLVIN
jgi:dynein heavy chain